MALFSQLEQNYQKGNRQRIADDVPESEGLISRGNENENFTKILHTISIYTFFLLSFQHK